MKNEEFLTPKGMSVARNATAGMLGGKWECLNRRMCRVLLCAAFFILHSSFFISLQSMKTSWKEVLLRAVIAALSATLTALGTTSCMGLGPISL